MSVATTRQEDTPAPTMNAIDLDSVFLHRSVAIRSSPAQGGSVGSNASKRHVGRLRHVDPENVNEVRDGFP